MYGSASFASSALIVVGWPLPPLSPRIAETAIIPSAGIALELIQ
jgi:hypothetical protein